jgi:hypothetical protein
MNGEYKELQNALQVLALPVTFHISLDVGNKCLVRMLSQPYFSWRRENMMKVLPKLSQLQREVLFRLDDVLLQASSLPDCSETTLRKYGVWRRTRLMARRALLAFGWVLKMPPLNSSVYRKILGEGQDDQFSKIRQPFIVQD